MGNFMFAIKTEIIMLILPILVKNAKDMDLSLTNMGNVYVIMDLEEILLNVDILKE